MIGTDALRLSFTVRGKVCGDVGRLQVRPPQPTRAPGTVGWPAPPRNKKPVA